jgi:hypothetical protein
MVYFIVVKKILQWFDALKWWRTSRGVKKGVKGDREKEKIINSN